MNYSKMKKAELVEEFKKLREQFEHRQTLLIQVLEVLNQSSEKVNIIRDLLLLIKRSTGFEAVGIRLKESEDFPYYETNGFPDEFVEAERYLCARDEAGEIKRDSQGKPYLECMCGNVICGRTNASLPFFTEEGSFWSNCTTELLASTTDEERQARTRNRCNGEGYESVALIPLRANGDTIGLLQLNDTRKGQFTVEMIQFFEKLGHCIGIAFAGKQAEEALQEAHNNLEVQVQERTAELVEASERLKHLNAVLRAIRGVNQLITKEHSRDKLLKGVCENLIETRGYSTTWIAVLDESQSLEAAAHAGLDDEFPALLERLKSGESVLCAREALEQSGILVKEEPASACTECPLSQKCFGGGVLTLRLEYGGKVYGLLSAAIPSGFGADEEEKSLFEEVVGDVAFALHGIEQEDEHKEAAEARRQSEERYRDLVETTDDLVQSVSQDGSIVFVNRAWRETLGYSEEEIRSMKMFDIIHPDSQAHCIEIFQRVVAGEEVESVEAKFLTKDGRTILVEGSASCRLVDGKPVATYGIFHDVTGRKKAEEAQRELEAQKMVVEKMKELDRMKSEFVSTVTHELRTPMTPLKSTIEMLLDGTLGELTDRQEKFISMMARNVDRLAQFTTEVLTLSRLESGRFQLEPRILSLRKALESVMELMQQKARSKNSTVSFDIDAEISAYADASSLAIVATNLTNNAIVHTDKGTQISVSARKLDKDLVEVSISDTGQGIPEESLDNLFDRFYQAKRKAGPGYQGTGVGLAVCKALVEAMGGEISVESRVGEGTTFKFTLPASPPQKEGERAKE